MAKIFEEGLKYKNEETQNLQHNYLLNVTNQIVNPDGKIPFLNLRNVFLRPNIDEGKISKLLIKNYLLFVQFIKGDPYDDVNHEEGDDDQNR